MSVNMLILIPVEPTYRPGPDLAEQAKELLRIFVPQAKEVIVQETKHVEFIATGGNLEKIFCPFCQCVLDEQWWSAEMDTAYNKAQFANVAVKLPCCGKISSLNDLGYDWPAGFACFQLLTRDPGNDIEEEHLKILEEKLSCKLRKLWVHF